MANKEKCITTGKIRYPTQSRAEDHIKHMRKSFISQAGHPAPTRSYQCGLCDGWHTTSQTAYTNTAPIIHKEDFKKYLQNGQE